MAAPTAAIFAHQSGVDAITPRTPLLNRKAACHGRQPPRLIIRQRSRPHITPTANSLAAADPIPQLIPCQPQSAMISSHGVRTSKTVEIHHATLNEALVVTELLFIRQVALDPRPVHHRPNLYCHQVGSLMKWVTRDHVHMDRVASPWLIRRFIDPSAEFIFVPFARTRTSPIDFVLPPDAIAFGIPGSELGPHDEHGSTFRKLLRKYSLDDAALEFMARIIESGVHHVFHHHDSGYSVAQLKHAEGVAWTPWHWVCSISRSTMPGTSSRAW